MSTKPGNGKGIESAETVKSDRTETAKSGRGELPESTVEVIPRLDPGHGPHEGPNYCTAKSKRSGRRCRRIAGPYLTVCSNHGSAAPQVKNAARKREMVAKAAAEVQARGFEPVKDPGRVLMALAGRSVRLMEVLEEQVAVIQAENLVHRDADGREFTAALVESYARSLKDASLAVGQLVKLGVEELVTDRDHQNAKVVQDCVERAVYSPESDLSEAQIEVFMRLFVAEIRRAFPDDAEVESAQPACDTT